MDCTHANIRELRTTGFTGPVNVREENRAAHGNVCVSEECCACGSRRDRLVNGRHEEVGSEEGRPQGRAEEGREEGFGPRPRLTRSPRPLSPHSAPTPGERRR